jgi:8-oxo-dGTP diphosphatase
MIFKVLKSKKVPEFKKITSVAIIAFNEKYEMAVVDLVERGWDLPGGHIEKNEKTLSETVKREFKEEICGDLYD